MDQFLQYTVLGLVLGAVYAIAASGLVVTYTTSGIFNFAHGAVAMLAAFTYWQLRFDWNWPAPLALFVVLGVLAPVTGAALYAIVMRGIRDTSEVTRIIVPISVMLGFLALSTWIWDPTPSTPRVFSKFFGVNKKVSIAGVNVTWHEIIAIFLAAAIALGLWLLFYRTRTGVAMRGVVDDPTLIRLTGGRPERLATMSWSLGAVLAALAGILITPIQGGALSATALTLLVIDAFAAAVFGRLRSLPRTFLGAMVLGLASNYVIAYFPSRWTWTGNFRVSLPMVMLFIVLLVLPQDRLRGAAVIRTRERFRVPSVRAAAGWGAALVAVVLLLREIMAPTAVGSLSFAMTLALVALSLVLLTGYAGEINLAALSFGAIGAIVVYHFGTTGSGPAARTTLWGYVFAAAACAVVGALVALPALRLRGLYLALATMAFGVFVSDIVLREIGPRTLPLVHWHFTVFPGGQLTVARPRFGPIDLHSDGTFLVFVTVLFAALGVVLVALRHGAYGRQLAALKDSPAASSTLGMNVLRLKLSVFMLSAAIAGVGGALMAAQLGSVNLDRFDIFLSLTLLMLTVVGGIGYVSGGLVGGLLAGVGFAAISNTFSKLGVDHATLNGLFDWLSRFTLVLPALVGVSMARNPSGAVSEITAAYRPLLRVKRVLVPGVAIEAIAYALAHDGAISNWWFVGVTAAVAITLPIAARLVAAETPASASAGGTTAEEVPAELVGVARPFTPTDRRELDAALSLTAVPRPLAPTRGGP